jgi:dynactin-4
VPYQLRTKRTKRCSRCKEALVIPDKKVSTTKFKMKALASSFLPRLTISPLNPTSSSSASALATLSGQLVSAEQKLTPGKTHQFLLTIKNPLYETIRVSLASKARTPGRFGHKITILCPQFEVGASRDQYADVWDEALATDGAEKSNGAGDVVAGKPYARGRNTTGVVVEVVPAPLSNPFAKNEKTVPRMSIGAFDPYNLDDVEGSDDDVDPDALAEDDDILEIPVRVRVEWEAEQTHGEGHHDGAGKGGGDGAEGKVKHELAFWVVLGVGRVAVD